MTHDFVTYMQSVTLSYAASGRYGTAHVYQSSLNALVAFLEKGQLPFDGLNPALLKAFESHLLAGGRSWNTVSTYLRMLRSVYNRAVSEGAAPYIPQLFKYLYTGTRSEHKRALDRREMASLFRLHRERKLPARLRQTLDIFLLMFLLRGIPFVDLACMKRGNLKGRTLTYRRRKTGRLLSVTLTREAAAIIRTYMNKDRHSPYLLPFLQAKDGSAAAYRQYQLALRRFNASLDRLRTHTSTGLPPISSYTARHTWATLAYHCEIHPGIISEAMGHSSISVTETYLKPFGNKKIDHANQVVIAAIQRVMQ